MTFRSKGSRALLVVPDSRRVRLYRVDIVGNNLDCVLRWCASHYEPVWVFDDGSFECPYDHMIDGCQHMNHTIDKPGDHEITDGPWEVPLT